MGRSKKHWTRSLFVTTKMQISKNFWDKIAMLMMLVKQWIIALPLCPTSQHQTYFLTSLFTWCYHLCSTLEFLQAVLHTVRYVPMFFIHIAYPKLQSFHVIPPFHCVSLGAMSASMQRIATNRGASPAEPCNITVEVVAALATVKGSVSAKPSELVGLELVGLLFQWLVSVRILGWLNIVYICHSFTWTISMLESSSIFMYFSSEVWFQGCR